MFPMTLTVHNQAQLQAIIAACLKADGAPTTGEMVADLSAKVQAKKDAAQAEAPGKPAKTSADKPAPGQPTAEVAGVGAQEKTDAAQAGQSADSAGAQQADSTAAAEPIPYAAVAAAITNMVKTNRDHVVATLAKFGAKKGPEVKAEDYPAFMAALEA